MDYNKIEDSFNSNILSERIEARIFDLQKNNGYGFDPFTIIAIVGLIVNVVKMIIACRQLNKMAKRNLKRNGLASRLFFKNSLYEPLREKYGDEIAAKVTEEAKLMFLDGTIEKCLGVNLDNENE